MWLGIPQRLKTEISEISDRYSNLTEWKRVNFVFNFPCNAMQAPPWHRTFFAINNVKQQYSTWHFCTNPFQAFQMVHMHEFGNLCNIFVMVLWCPYCRPRAGATRFKMPGAHTGKSGSRLVHVPGSPIPSCLGAIGTAVASQPLGFPWDICPFPLGKVPLPAMRLPNSLLAILLADNWTALCRAAWPKGGNKIQVEVTTVLLYQFCPPCPLRKYAPPVTVKLTACWLHMGASGCIEMVLGQCRP